jgi:hypothetical protein
VSSSCARPSTCSFIECTAGTSLCWQFFPDARNGCPCRACSASAPSPPLMIHRGGFVAAAKRAWAQGPSLSLGDAAGGVAHARTSRAAPRHRRRPHSPGDGDEAAREHAASRARSTLKQRTHADEQGALHHRRRRRARRPSGRPRARRRRRRTRPGLSRPSVRSRQARSLLARISRHAVDRGHEDRTRRAPCAAEKCIKASLSSTTNKRRAPSNRKQVAHVRAGAGAVLEP